MQLQPSVRCRRVRLAGVRTGLRSVSNARARSAVRSASLAVMLLASCAAMAAIPSSASASAVGCTTSGFGLPHGLSSAYTCIDVEGTPNRGGRWVSTVQVSWIGAGTICNWRMQLRWYTDTGRRYLTNSSPLHTSCRFSSAVWDQNFGRGVWSNTYGYYYTGRQMRVGQVCAYLIENGRVRSGVPCESIEA